MVFKPERPSEIKNPAAHLTTSPAPQARGVGGGGGSSQNCISRRSRSRKNFRSGANPHPRVC
ncbi:hypothetical protein HMPREF9120_02626 [Neisseria sp. oral taxon 020 str. F0370]|nr:hypothetical protein HMPREF9120_02626 [Neisseria sp. oral taxon 020 str. F0370]